MKLKKRKPLEGQLSASRVPSISRRTAAILLIALLSTSCASLKPIRTIDQREAQDSVVVNEVLTTKVVPIPAVEIKATIPVVSLGQLPDGASFSGKNGRASFKITRIKDSIYVTSSCDSLAIMCENYRKEITALRSRKEKTVQTLQASGFWSSIKKYAIGAVFGFLIAILLRIFIYFSKRL